MDAGAKEVVILQPSHQIGGVDDRLPLDRMTERWNSEYDEEDDHLISTVESSIPEELLEIPHSLGYTENIEDNVEINGMIDESLYLSQTVGDNYSGRMLSIFKKFNGKVEQLFKLDMNMDEIHGCLKGPTKNKLLNMGLKLEKRLPSKGINYEVHWRDPIDGLRRQN